ncbi:MAG: hypothetical protein HKN76_15705 [Saprospiraceae bacterium]|nr:hypothetical protein [Saprospiraceae bacterium]
MKNKLSNITCVLIGWLCPVVILAQTSPRFQESGGIMVIEIESAANYDAWELDTGKSGYTGEGYLQYKGPNFYNNPGNSLLSFEIAIEKTGKYRFQWHSLIAVGQSNTEHNDSWLRFNNASDFYGEKNEQRVYPKGVGKMPNPNGTSTKGWLKIYQNNQNGWTWVTRTSDHDPHEIFVEFDSIGIYTLEISGRSSGHAINRLALFHSEVEASQALDLSRPESERLETVAVRKSLFKTLQIRPTLADQFIYIDLPTSIPAGEYKTQITNMLGQRLQSVSFRIDGESEVAIPVDLIGKGIYTIGFRKGSFYYQGKFIKQ